MKAKFDLIAQVLGFRNFKHMENVSSAGCAARRKRKGLTSRYGVKLAAAVAILAVTVGAQGAKAQTTFEPLTTLCARTVENKLLLECPERGWAVGVQLQ